MHVVIKCAIGAIYRREAYQIGCMQRSTKQQYNLQRSVQLQVSHSFPPHGAGHSHVY